MQSHNNRGLLLVLLLAIGLFAMALLAAVEAGQIEPIVPVSRSVAADPVRVSLGERLFHDARLSRHRTHSCATCHPLGRGGMDGLRAPSHPTTGLPLRNTPTIFNASLNASFNWDGVAPTLEDHTTAVIEGLMGFTWPELLERLRSDPAYRTTFAATYSDGLAQSSVVNAIVAFERTLVTTDAPFDRFLRGDNGALTQAEQDGYQQFRVYGCASCHQGVNVGGNLYQRFGIFEPVSTGFAPPMDPGRFRVTTVPRDMEVFRVPSLRNVAVTAPYFHDGRAFTLEEAVDTMGRHQLGRTLDVQDVRLIVTFLQSLTGHYDGRPVTAARPRTTAEP